MRNITTIANVFEHSQTNLLRRKTMNTINLNKLEDFTPKIALKVLQNYFSKADLNHISLSTSNLNLISNDMYDKRQIKYVVSIGDALYYIVVVHGYDKQFYVDVGHSHLCGTRICAKEFVMKLEDFTYDFALNFLKECLHENISNRDKLIHARLNFIRNGILDSNMKKYVVNSGYDLYQIAALKETTSDIVSLVVK